MNIALATDHAGYDIKNTIQAYLENLGHTIHDFGPNIYDKNDDYPDYMIPAVQSVQSGKNERAILICTNGIGACILANKLSNIRGATLFSESSARKTRQDPDSNVACLPAKEFDEASIKSFINTWLEEAYNGGRHERRMQKIMNLEK